MADLTQTPANVSFSSTTARIEAGIAGATLACGDQVYKDPADNKWKLASTTSATTANIGGMALTPSTDTAAVAVLAYRDGLVMKPGATVAIGEAYGVSTNDGKIAPTSDWTTNDYMTQIGIGTSTSEITIALNITGVQHP